MRPTDTKKFTPIFDFIEIGGEASSDGNGWASEAGGDAVERITLPCGGRFYVRSLCSLKRDARDEIWHLGHRCGEGREREVGSFRLDQALVLRWGHLLARGLVL